MPHSPLDQRAPLRRSLHVPADLLAEARNEPLLRGFRVLSVGYFARDPEHQVYRSTWGNEYVLILCLEGRGWLQIENTRSDVEAGDILCCPARAAHNYGARPQDPWRIIWAHCLGPDLDNLFVRMGFSSHRPLKVGSLNEAEALLQRALSTLEGGFDITRLVAASGAVRQALLVLWKASVSIRVHDDPVTRVLDLLRAEPAIAWSVIDLAAQSGLSRAQFSRRVHERVGMGPIDYLIRLRLQRAAELLVTTRSPISHVAEDVGYTDPYYFSRLFGRIMGLSPRAYRQRYGG